ncbi:acetyltransferase [Canibacter sp. lx-72]|uniref:acyltransferase family protein n=1 Tax=Canibacter zhuwentaonis TaxID=2837491 RepID=UPI001BDDC103|nr:acyltransferase family protein [Canibacter zhuwentaonis]MBT1018171.1 acetyltransferase [Canibacter zhuwentaonis]
MKTHPRSATQARNPLGYAPFPGLTGLRAIAVIAVVIYHFFPKALPGGFLGVDIFFCVSGFLITSLLLREYSLTGRINLPGFWKRRARRLLPALAVTLAVSASLAGLLGGDILLNLRGQLLSSALFAANWFYIIKGSNYFTQDAPELFRNTWSLGVEEQFYLLLPLLLLLLKRAPNNNARLAVFLLCGGASVLAMTSMSAAGVSASRIYFGSDSHSSGLLLGASLALALHRKPGSHKAPSWYRQIVYMLGTCSGLIALLIMFLILQEGSAESFQGGILLVTFATIGIITCVTGYRSLPGKLLDSGPLKEIGQKSYGIYLWHWPLLLITSAAFEQLSPDWRALLVPLVTLPLTFVAATFSYRYIEQPIRQGGFINSLRKLAAALSPQAPSRIRALAFCITSAMLLSLTGTGFALAQQPRASRAQIAIERGVQALEQQRSAQPRDPGKQSDTPDSPPGNPAQHPHTTENATAHAITGDKVSAVGDSVMLASAGELTAALPNISVDAAVSRHFGTGIDIFEQLRANGELREYMIVALATNGPIRTEDLARLAEFSTSHKMVVVTGYANRSWIAENNQMLAHFAQVRRGVTLADWNAAIAAHLEKLAGDEIHPEPAGAEIYAKTVADALQRLNSHAEQPQNSKIPYLLELTEQRSKILPQFDLLEQ